MTGYVNVPPELRYLADVKCGHCDKNYNALEDKASVLVTVLSPVMEDPAVETICGWCAFELGEFLCPQLLDDVGYQLIKVEAKELMQRAKTQRPGESL